MKHLSKPWALALSTALLLGAAVLAIVAGRGGEREAEGVGRSATAVAAPAGAAAMRAYIDPATGQKSRVPVSGEAPADAGQLAERFSQRVDDLYEEVGPRGVGVKVDLQGRFMSATVATIEPDGTVSVRCEEPAVEVAGQEEADREDR